jgi:hypothetical protein
VHIGESLLEARSFEEFETLDAWHEESGVFIDGGGQDYG